MEDMYDPTMRVLTVLELLQARERVTGTELAARLEVHPRTVQRYIGRLQDLGIPVQATRGAGGAYFLRPGFRLPPMMFSDEEALALTLGLRSLSYLGLSAFAPASAGAAAKLERVLPGAVKERVRATLSAVKLDTDPWLVSADAEQIIALAAAVGNARTVRLNYTARAGEAAEREVDPYGVLYHDGRWYLVAQCHLRAALRCFRVDRIQKVHTLEQTFVIPPGFDARTFLLESLASTPTSWQVSVWLGTPPESARMQALPAQARFAPERGGTRLSCGVENLETLAVTLLYLGCRVEVSEPPELLEAFGRVAGRAREIADNSLTR